MAFLSVSLVFIPLRKDAHLKIKTSYLLKLDDTSYYFVP